MRIPHGLRAALASQGAAPPAPSSDANFENVSLLLHGDGTNGAQNNTFVDGSTNNFTITRNGNTTQGTFSPFSPTGWSGYFDGSGDYLSSTGSGYALGSGDYTVELWVYHDDQSGSRGYLCTGASPTSDTWQMNLNGGTVYFYPTGTTFITGSGINLYTWHHVAATRSGSTVRLFVDGVLQSSTTNSTNLANTNLKVGTNRGGSAYFNGYMSNVRILKGTALYTSNFTPPTSPLTAITNTSLLTLQDNRFKDNSTNNFTITSNGDTKIEAFSPFNPTAAYSASTHGGSGYFDGTGDYLSVANSNSFAFGTGDFTVEFWLYAFSSSNIHGLVASSATGYGYWASIIYNDIIYWQSANGSTNLFSASYDKYNQWTHVAFVRNSGTTKLYLNGVQTASAGDGTDYAGTAGNIDIGRDQDNSALLTGHISNLRILKGTAVYTSAFTPPTAPLTAITNTSLLLNFTNAGIIDNASKNVLETVGDAQISTSVKKFGTGSMYFDGTGDYLSVVSSSNFAFGTGDFTIEYWINTSTSADNGILQISTTAGGFATSYTNGLMMSLFSGTLYYALGGSSTNTGTTINNGNWRHITMCRSGSSLKIFVDGISIVSTTNTTNVTATNLVIGGYYSTSYTLSGYIDDLRITKGVARYTANFTPPTAAFPDL